MKTKDNKKEALISMPLSGMKFLSSYPKEKKIILEIKIQDIKRVNEAGTLDEIINESRFDYIVGNYKTFNNAKDLISELRS